MKISSQRKGSVVNIVVNLSADCQGWDVTFVKDCNNEFNACLLREKLAETMAAIAQEIGWKGYLLGWKHAKAKTGKLSRGWMDYILES